MKRLIVIASIVPFIVLTAAQAEPQADNTKKNVRDRNQQTVTPEDQSNNKSDLKITSNIRKKILKQKGFSTNAQNVKVIAQNGVVTLRGPVDSQTEYSTIENLAKGCSGVTSISNQLEIKAPR